VRETVTTGRASPRANRGSSHETSTGKRRSEPREPDLTAAVGHRLMRVTERGILPAEIPNNVAPTLVDLTFNSRALHDPLRLAIAHRRGYCSWEVDHAGWVVRSILRTSRTSTARHLRKPSPGVSSGSWHRSWGLDRSLCERVSRERESKGSYGAQPSSVDPAPQPPFPGLHVEPDVPALASGVGDDDPSGALWALRLARAPAGRFGEREQRSSCRPHDVVDGGGYNRRQMVRPHRAHPWWSSPLLPPPLRPRCLMPFYPDDAPVPTELRTDEFLLRPQRWR
jgi:hypothetical protein